MRSLGRMLFSAVLAVSAVVQTSLAGPAVVINEIMASNSRTVKDPQGQYDDWIELYNPGDATANIAGMYLTDDPANPRKWKIPPATTVAAKGYLVIWADGDVQDSGLHANFSLSSDGETLALYASDGRTLVDSVTFGPQRSDISYGRNPDGVGPWQYMGAPSPGAANGRSFDGVVANPKFSHERGFYDATFNVSIQCETPDAFIYYTLDGSDPVNTSGSTSNGIPYAGPIPITQTTCLRVAAARTSWMPSTIVTQTYIFLSDVIKQPAGPAGFPATWGSETADYQMDPDIVNDPCYAPQLKNALLSLPSLSIVTSLTNLFDTQTGFYANPTATGVAWERPCSAELIYPDGTPGFQVNCGIRVQGGAFRNWSYTPKKSLRLLFKSIYGPTTLKYPLFGDDAADQFNTITLRAGANDGYSWRDARYTEQYTRDQFGHDLQRATGNASSHGMFVHLYVNGLYWGLYNPVERPDASFSAGYYDGNADEWDAINSGSPTSGNTTAWNQMLAKCQRAADSDAAFQEVQGKNPDGTPNPAYPNLLDVTNYIDYLIVNLWGGNWDWPGKNYWVGRDRSANSTGFKFYCWDYENTMGNNASRSPLTMVAPNNGLNGTWSIGVGMPHSYLQKNAEYRLLFADRVHRFLFDGAALTPESLVPRYQALAATVEKAIIVESARWGDQSYTTQPLTQQDWLTERDWILKTYLPQRTAIVLQQFRTAGLYPNIDAPVFSLNGVNQHGGHVAANAALSMQNPNTGTSTIWYTLDGSDPRIPGSGTTGGSSSSVTLVAENAAKKVLVPTAAVNNAWRGGADFNDSAWISGTGGVGYERSTGYESYFSINVNAQMYNKNGSCFIRVPFTVASADIGKVSSLTLNMRCDDGFIAYINGVEVARKNFTGTPAWNSLAGAATNDVDAVELQAFDLSAYVGALVAGTNILAIQGLNETLTSSDFLISETLTAVRGSSATTPAGVSPTAIKYTSAVTLTASTHIKARILSGSTWSALNEAIYAVGPVASGLRISEIMYHPLNSGNPNDPNTEFVELTNVGSAQINLNFVQFTKGVTFTFGNLDLAPKAYTLVVKDLAAFKAKYGNTLPIAGQYDGSLSNSGERIQLVDAAGQVIEDFTYADGWYDMTDGQGFSLTAANAAAVDANGFNDASFWRPSAHIGGSPGYDDTGLVPPLGAVVINEIMANPKSGQSDWIELYNTTDQPIHIGEWFLSDDGDNLMKYQVAAGTSIPAKGYIVFTAGLNFGNGADPGCRVPFGFSKDGETAYLTSGSGGVLTGYTQQEHFDATETGVSIGRYNKSAGGYNFVELTSPTPGAVNAAPKVGPIVISEIMYNPIATPDSEYVELLNISDAPVPLYDPITRQPWRLTAGDPNNPTMELLFPTDSPITLEPGQRMILTKDSEGFNWQFGAAPTGVPILAWGLGWLSNDGDKVQISKPAGAGHWIRVDRVVYSDGSHPDFGVSADPWPKAADGQGQSLARIDPTAYGNDPANWHAATPTPGR